MLAFFSTEGRGAADAMLCDVAARLRSEGVRLAGAVQVNLGRPDRARCDMDLHVLNGTEVVRISQNLGAGSSGCRLDPGGLERAVGLAEAALAGGGVDLVIVNKFGKQEIEGRGFRPLIGEALAAGLPVLIAVNTGNLEEFHAFSAGIAEALPPEEDRILAWCRSALDAADRPARAV
ncbi:nucleoside-triphosphatase THEP1 [Rhodovulum iodosum]|uniref:Nucleoside-triphosphatase THEP1 n=1 Tax=Rhodovulum iodosum TaxID=68291 RepID=A0ABV3XQV8_9RHOB|nr:DUF2478 domain-containing protein [Rhodovulum robiginosum]RSK31520.1 DUF2478 domain-containing protein [Rhodovulum robiginosum]